MRLAIGLVGGDPAAALAGWRDYFWLGEKSAPQAFGMTDDKVQSIFESGLWNGASVADRLALAALLMRAGFDDELRRFVTDFALADAGQSTPPVWKPIATYLDLRAKLEAETLAHDRLFARKGATDEEAYEKRLIAIMADAAAALGQTGGDHTMALHEAFGLWGVTGITNGVMSLHLGHTVIDERQRVAQFGREGTIRFIALDNMIANSFSAWLMDGDSAPGGWATGGDTIIQVRPVYVRGIDGVLAISREGPARARVIAEVAAGTATDRSIAANGKIVYLPGMRGRLRLQGIDDLAATVRNRAAMDYDLGFRTSYWNAINASSITYHEGRHILDQATYKDAATLPDAELEYRAKLSEIAFSDTPRLSLASIYSPPLGEGSSHGIANERLIRDYAAWIVAHRREIKGFDPALTDLEQLDKLTNEQLRTVARSLDPATPRR